MARTRPATNSGGNCGSTSGARRGEPLAQIVLTASQPGQKPWAVIVGAVTLLLGATAMFGQMQAALNQIWKTPSAGSFGRQVLDFLKRKLLTFPMVLLFGFLFLVLMILTSFGPSLRAMSPEPAVPWAVNFYVAYRSTLSFVLVSLLLAMAYKILPDAHIRWSDVWVGSLATSGAMLVGELLIGLYLRHAHFGSAYGAAGSLAVLLVWVYYSAMVFLLGAEFTHVWAQQRAAKANV